jgi:hypothetical protein
MVAARRVKTVVLLALLLSACGRPGIRVTSAEYGEAWPFTVQSGTLNCERESRRSNRLFVTLDTGDGIMYGLNGAAQSFGYPAHRSILKPGKTGADVQPFIKLGLTLCNSN